MTDHDESDHDTPHPGNDSRNPLVVGRMTEATDEFVVTFTSSVGFDQRMFSQDIRGSIAHANMLARIGVLSPDETQRIVAGLMDIHKEIERGEMQWSETLEDVHMNIENRLIERIGETGKKLHTGRSRNDQVATDIRLYLRDEIDQLDDAITQLLDTLVTLAEQHSDTVMPGYTHLQPAQPITFGHHILAWYEMLYRDRERMRDCRKRVNQLPLGAAALAGSTFPLDRPSVAAELEFAGVCENSLDAVSDRDFAIEFCAAASICMTHFSRWCEELVLWASQQFNFVTLPDRFCTGSSIMPQKKNPDVPELIRGKTGRVNGHLVALLTLMKSQPLAYNKDNQEDKEPLFDCIDTLKACVTALNGLIPAIEPNKENLLRAAVDGYTTATDLADFLVKQGLPFRDAHHAVGAAVGYAIGTDKHLHELTLDELNSATGLQVSADVYDVLEPMGSASARDHFGGTAPTAVKQACARARERLST